MSGARETNGGVRAREDDERQTYVFQLSLQQDGVVMMNITVTNNFNERVGQLDYLKEVG